MEKVEDIAAPKPKKVLTEAQRLAFLKGREKRMANLEKKRLEKLEAFQQESTPAPPPPPVPESKPLPPPTPIQPQAPPPPAAVVIDENKIAERVASLVVERMPKKRTYTVKPKPTPPPAPTPPSPPRIQSFSWT